MAKVPTFEGGQRRAPLHQSNFTVRATPEAFGAATGRGLGALGQGVGNLSEAVSTVADLRAQNVLKNAQADYMEGARTLVSDPETGFLSRTGSDAINGLAAVEAQLEELGRGIAERLPGQVRPRFRDFRIGHNTDLGREILRHKAEQTKAETRSASDRRIAVLKQEAVRNHTDPVAHVNSLSEAENEFRTMAGLEGLSNEATEQMLAQHRDGVQSDIILQMAEADPLLAQARYEAVRDSLQEETRQGIERRITPAVKIAKADAKAGALFAGLQADGSTDPVDHVTKFLVKNVANNAPNLSDDAASDTLSGSAEGDTLETPEQSDTLKSTLQGPTLERARQLEEVDDLLRRRGDALAHRLNHAGVMLSPGNLIFAQALGAPLAIAFNEADPSLPAAEVMAQAMGWSLSAEQLTELDQRLAGRSTGNFLAEFSTAAATLSGGPDVAAELAAISDPEERQFAEAGLAVNLSKATNQRRGEADERIARAFESLEQSETLSGIPPTEKAELTGMSRSRMDADCTTKSLCSANICLPAHISDQSVAHNASYEVKMFSPVVHNEIVELAASNNLEPAALLAIAAVESAGVPFWRVGGRDVPPMRFEGHYFYRLLKGRVREKAVSLGLAHPRVGGVPNPRSWLARYALLERAKAVDENAALMSCSWGLGQVMGAHYAALGYTSLQAMVAKAFEGVTGQVDLMVRFIDKNGLRKFVNTKNWAAFAHAYNGPGYRKNRYDAKMASAYARYTGKGKRLNSAAAEIQRDLRRLGYDTGPVDGVIGNKTKSAILQFQTDNGLIADGLVGAVTQEAIDDALARRRRKKKESRRAPVAAGFGAVAAGLLIAAYEKIMTFFVWFGGFLP